MIKGIERGEANRVELGLHQNWLKGAERLGHVIDIFESVEAGN